jgi:hypothetical protein
MKKLTWDEYYDNFYDWSLSTQKSYSSGLTSYGSADEVFEVVSEFVFHDKKFANRFVDKALSAGVQFTPDQILELTILIEKPILTRMAETASPPFNREQLEEIYMLIDDEVFDKISKNQNIDIFNDDAEPEETVPEWDETIPEPAPPKLGFLGTLFAVLAGLGSASNSSSKKHNGRCNGDCANCPPHYGYRYGRWYYGHDHVHGCEFGGNKGSGSMD